MISPKKNLEKISRVEHPATTRLGFLRLDKNENIIELGDSFLNKVRSKIDSGLISSYPEVYFLYQKISQWLNIDQDRLYISAGSDGAIKAVFEVFVEDGDEVIILHPTYAMYYVYSEIFGANLKKIGYDKNLYLEPESIKKAITSKTKLICVANPNSPTGTVVERSKLLDIINYAQEREILVLIDEAYYLYYSETLISEISSFSNLIVTRSFTKAYGLASARLGFAVSNPYIISCLKKVRPIYEVNSFSILLGNLIIDNENIVMDNMKLFSEGKEYLMDSLKSLGLKFFKSYANFVLIDMGSRELALIVKEELYIRKILINAGYTNVPMDRCIRVSISEKKHMMTFIRNLKDVLQNLNNRD